MLVSAAHFPVQDNLGRVHQVLPNFRKEGKKKSSEAFFPDGMFQSEGCQGCSCPGKEGASGACLCLVRGEESKRQQTQNAAERPELSSALRREKVNKSQEEVSKNAEPAKPPSSP